MSMQAVTSSVRARDLLDTLAALGQTHLVGVPDSEFKTLINTILEERASAYIPAVREDHAIAVAAGLYLTGKKPLVFMENSGLGTSCDALTSLAKVYRLPIPMLVAWAGYKGEDVPHHNVMGLGTEALLDAFQVPWFVMPTDVSELKPFLENVFDTAYRLQTPVAILVLPGGITK